MGTIEVHDLLSERDYRSLTVMGSVQGRNLCSLRSQTEVCQRERRQRP